VESLCATRSSFAPPERAGPQPLRSSSRRRSRS
jgi:hypothetical protein